jgi:hypothetical protein
VRVWGLCRSRLSSCLTLRFLFAAAGGQTRSSGGEGAAGAGRQHIKLPYVQRSGNSWSWSATLRFQVKSDGAPVGEQSRRVYSASINCADGYRDQESAAVARDVSLMLLWGGAPASSSGEFSSQESAASAVSAKLSDRLSRPPSRQLKKHVPRSRQETLLFIGR